MSKASVLRVEDIFRDDELLSSLGLGDLRRARLQRVACFSRISEAASRLQSRASPSPVQADPGQGWQHTNARGACRHKMRMRIRSDAAPFDPVLLVLFSRASAGGGEEVELKPARVRSRAWPARAAEICHQADVTSEPGSSPLPQRHSEEAPEEAAPKSANPRDGHRQNTKAATDDSNKDSRGACPCWRCLRERVNEPPRRPRSLRKSSSR